MPRQVSFRAEDAAETDGGGTSEHRHGSTDLLSLAPLDWFVHVLLAANAEVLDGLGDTFQRAVDVLGVHVLCVVVKCTARTRERKGC